MKIAYLILTHDNPIHLKRLIDSLDGKNINFYIHIDKKSNMDICEIKQKNIHILQKRTKVYWGGYSIVEATLELLKEAYESKSDYYILLSGCDYPVKSNESIQAFLHQQQNANYINIGKMPLNGKSFSRLENYFIEGGNRSAKWDFLSKMIFIINMAFRKLPFKRYLPKEYLSYELYAGSQWWCITFEFVEYLLNFVNNNPKFTNYYKHTLIPDEMFFHTIIMNSPFKDTVKSSFTYSDWSIGKPPFPSYLEEIHMPIIHLGFLNDFYGKREILFARKFKDNSKSLVNLIDSIRT